jgi:hypothetical protein
VVYLAIRLQREKFAFSTQWRVDDSTLTLRRLQDFKKEKIGEASKLLGISKIQRNVTVSALFKHYLEHLRRHEQEKGEYVTEERTNSYRGGRADRESPCAVFRKDVAQRCGGKSHALPTGT